LRQYAILRAHELRQLAFQPVLGTALLQIDGRHQQLAGAVLQGRHLRAHQRRLAGQAQVVVPGQEHRAGRRRLPGMRMLAAQQLLDTGDVVQVHAPGDKIRQRRRNAGSGQRRSSCRVSLGFEQ
jgi:hypothetical protein